MAGYSGGRKVIVPGLAHAETITTFHNARFMADPFTSNCNLESNPLHEEQLEIVRMLGGYPLDRTYYQTVKGMVCPLYILQLGGRKGMT
jgi:nickel-dependent lactate racemase